MIIDKTLIEGAFLITRTPAVDNRGSFARMFCQREFEKAGIEQDFKQINLCNNYKRGTLRGLHYQKGGKLEDKLVACTSGRIYDVCADIRKESATYGKHVAFELSEQNGRMLYIPKGCAHGYVTLEDNSQLLYLMSEFYVPGLEGGYRYDDPFLAVNWPVDENLVISEKDLMLPYITE